MLVTSLSCTSNEGPAATSQASVEAGGPDSGALESGASESGASESGAQESGQGESSVAGGGCAVPGAICWDFETGTLPSGWVPYRNEYSGQLVVDATRPHRGRYALHAKDLIGGTEGAQGGPKKTIRFDLPAQFGPTLWGRAYVFTTPSRPASHAGLFNARYPRPDSTATAIDKLDWYEVATYTQNYMTVWHPPEPPGYPEWVQVSDVPLVLDDWACLEWLFDGRNREEPQAANPRMWVDGVELTWPTSFVFSDPATTTRPVQEKATNFTVLEVGAYLYQGLPIATNWWLDDLAVSPVRVGCD
jgi:hypothetical protein